MFGVFLAMLASVCPAAELPMLRSAEDPRPQVVVSVGQTEVLAHVDLAGGGHRVGWGTVYGAGLKTRRREGPRGERTVARIPELTLGDVVLTDLVAEVGGTDDLVLGASTLEGLEVALLPSEGVVRVARSGLVEAVGEPVVASRQTARAWWRHGERHFGDGHTLVVPVEGGVVHLRTDREETVWARGEGEAHEGMVTASMGHPLQPDGPMVRGWVSGVVEDPHPEWMGALGWGALFDRDLAVAPDRDAVAWSAAEAVQWTDARAWWAEHEVLDAGRATALWRLGEVDGALEATEATLAEGECLPWMVLGLRRQRAGVDGVFGPLENAMGQWTAWSSLMGVDRQRIRAGKRVRGVDLTEPDGSCAQATGRWLLARLADGEDAEIVAEDAGSYDEGLDAWVPLAEGLARLRAGDPARAEVALRRASTRGGERRAWLALAVALAEQGREEPARALLDRVAWDDPQPLTTAWIAARAGLLPRPEDDGPERPGFLAREVVRTALAAAWGAAEGARGVVLVDDGLVSAVERARWQTADAAWALAAHRVLLGLGGAGNGAEIEALDEALRQWEARSPEVWTARELLGKPGAAEARGKRFPELP